MNNIKKIHFQGACLDLESTVTDIESKIEEYNKNIKERYIGIILNMQDVFIRNLRILSYIILLLVFAIAICSAAATFRLTEYVLIGAVMIVLIFVHLLINKLQFELEELSNELRKELSEDLEE